LRRAVGTYKTARRASAKGISVQNELSSSSPLGLLGLQLLERWRRTAGRGLFFVAENEDRAERLGLILHKLDETDQILVFPRSDDVPFDGAPPSSEVSGRRASVLRRLAERTERPLLVTTPEALIQRVPEPTSWRHASLRLSPGRAFDAEEITRWLADAGYNVEDEPDYPGNALMQAQVLEVFPAGALSPVRIEHSDGIVQRIASFDPSRQSAIVPLNEAVLDPFAERRLGLNGSATHSATVFEYATEAVLIGDAAVEAAAERWFKTIAELGSSEPKECAFPFLSPTEWREATRNMEVLPPGGSDGTIPRFAVHDSAEKRLRVFIAACRRRGTRVILTAADRGDLSRMERLAGVGAERFASWSAAATAQAEVAAALIDFEQGFMLSGSPPTAVIASADVLGSRARHLQPMAKPWLDPFRASELPKVGDLVVHVHRGLAMLSGLETLPSELGETTEMARLLFAKEQAVLVPISELALVWPYPADPGTVTLDKADGTSWTKRAATASREIKATAAHILKTVRERECQAAPRIVPPPALYERFAARFPHILTADQAKAIDDVLRDLASGHPMDRVVCGDVGFGKTEVALRAAAAALFSGMQVAVAAPTTVLARQHAATFGRRFAPFDIEVGLLSRLGSAQEQRDVKSRLRSGSLHVVIGTHALAGDDIKFAKLGLVVIDEEQHFGATQKRKLFELSRGVHRLSMSATPIPRTLAGSITGLNDLSVIASAPVQRIGVVTKTAPLTDDILAAALRRERRRGGQSFVICPRIRDIEPMFERLQRSVPELTIVRLHGRLPVQEIEETMMQFVDARADVLLATNIIENGLDIPRANTILICWPERFGFAQLHQLRGRVGRGRMRAFAYLLSEANGDTAHQRLLALQSLSRPGAGLEISERDLELRGGGDLLSDAQSGRVNIFGPSLYRWLLGRILQGKSAAARSLAVPELHLGVPELLPTEYVSNEGTRLEIYLKLGKSAQTEDIDTVGDELENRFGKLPREARDLLAIARLRLACRRLGVVRLEAGPAGVAATIEHGRSIVVTAPLSLHGDRVVLKRSIPSDRRLIAANKLLHLMSRSRNPAVPAA
jgi:transcription-repair coupling factor (superfamily II helicase)